MSSLPPRTLGERIPDLPHAVSCSLPTLAAVIGYEEKDPAVTQHLTSGYPRFVKHPFLRQVADHVVTALGRPDCHFWPTAHAAASRELCRWLEPHPAEAITYRGVQGVLLPRNDEAFRSAKTFLQHTGQLLCSREAEDFLVRVGAIPHAAAEVTWSGDAERHIRDTLLPYLRPAEDRDLFLTANGMNAIYAAFRVLDELQRARGRTVWLQLGWLYLDTIAILQKFTAEPTRDYVYQKDVFDLRAVEVLFERHAGQIAGVITEFPTNPLIQSCDLPRLRQLCDAAGAALIIDPSIASVGNVDVLSTSDVLVTSLTKFTAADGDVIAGAIAVNPQSAFADQARLRLGSVATPLYSRELARLAAQVGELEPVLRTINASTPAIVTFLRQHPRVEEVYWAQQPYSEDNYNRHARSPACAGSLVSFTVRGDVAPVYDRLRLAKGPSFGMRTTLICPFIYLAHYDLVSTTEGRAELRRNGINPQLLRMSIGCEPTEEILGALREALA